MMKKRISIFIALILVFSFAGTALAAEFSAQLYDEGQVDPYPGDLGHVSITNDDTAIDARNAFDALFQDWEMNGYPDDVGNVYYDDATGNIVITLVNGTEARRQEILAMAGNAEGIGFGESKYSYNRMLAVQQEIQADMAGAADKVHSVGVGWGSDADGNVAGFGESGKEARVVVTVAESALDEYRGAYEAKYGDMVYVVSGTAPVLLEEDAGASRNPWLLPAAITLFVLAALTVLFVNRSRLVPAMRASDGTTVTSAQRLSRKEVVKAVEESAVSPSEGVREKLMNEIDK